MFPLFVYTQVTTHDLNSIQQYSIKKNAEPYHPTLPIGAYVKK